MSKLRIDKVLKGNIVFHSHGGSDMVGGEVFPADMEFPSTGFIMNDGTNRWYVTIDTSGALVTTIIATGGVGSPMGLLLALTYAA